MEIEHSSWDIHHSAPIVIDERPTFNVQCSMLNVG